MPSRFCGTLFAILANANEIVSRDADEYRRVSISTNIMKMSR